MAIGAIGAGLLSGAATIYGTQQQNQANSAQALRQMEFQERMSGTAHQREVEDLRKAGLNPILSALGPGASSGSGASAEMQNPAEGVSKGIETAMALRAQNQLLKNQEKEIETKGAQISNINQDTINKAKTGNLIDAQTVQTATDTRLKRANIGYLGVDTKYKGQQSELLGRSMQAQLDKLLAEGKYAEAKEILNLINSGASSASSLINPLKGIKINAPKPNNIDKEIKEFLRKR